jgi:hypothetical protein
MILRSIGIVDAVIDLSLNAFEGDLLGQASRCDPSIFCFVAA